jgi:hypothetical protein
MEFARRFPRQARSSYALSAATAAPITPLDRRLRIEPKTGGEIKLLGEPRLRWIDPGTRLFRHRCARQSSNTSAVAKQSLIVKNDGRNLRKNPQAMRLPYNSLWRAQPQCCLKNCTAFSCFFAAARVLKVPRLRRLPVFGFFFREYKR